MKLRVMHDKIKISVSSDETRRV